MPTSTSPSFVPGYFRSAILIWVYAHDLVLGPIAKLEQVRQLCYVGAQQIPTSAGGIRTCMLISMNEENGDQSL